MELMELSEKRTLVTPLVFQEPGGCGRVCSGVMLEQPDGNQHIIDTGSQFQ
jgi:hypothetical protein